MSSSGRGDVEAIEAVSSYAKSPVDVGQFETQEVSGKQWETSVPLGNSVTRISIFYMCTLCCNRFLRIIYIYMIY